MDNINLFSPETLVHVGPYYFRHGIELEIYSSQSSYFDWGRVRFSAAFRPKISLESRTPATVWMGYNGDLQEVFRGYVSQPYDGSDLNEIILKDDMLKLEETVITNTFLDAGPKEIISFALARAGVDNYQLFADTYARKKVFPVSRRNVIELLKQVGQKWGIDKPFFFSSGVFYWGAVPRQDRVYQFDYGSNIISLTRAGGLWQLETVSVPFIRHSHIIAVSHPQISGEFEVRKIVFSTDTAGFIRTTIYF